MTDTITATSLKVMGSDIDVVNAARVSFNKRSEMERPDPFGSLKLKSTDVKLIQYLARHKHLSPFGHCFASFHIQAPVFVARQLVKHKFLRWNEISRRYVSDKPTFYRPKVWRGRSVDKKQGSDGVVKLDDYRASEPTVYQQALDEYQSLIAAGVCPEQARMVLPQAMMTAWYWSGSLDAFADMCRLRISSDTQKETQEVAKQINKVMLKAFPFSWLALMELVD